jgi:hypothetical protein
MKDYLNSWLGFGCAITVLAMGTLVIASPQEDSISPKLPAQVDLLFPDGKQLTGAKLTQFNPQKKSIEVEKRVGSEDKRNSYQFSQIKSLNFHGGVVIDGAGTITIWGPSPIRGEEDTEPDSEQILVAQGGKSVKCGGASAYNLPLKSLILGKDNFATAEVNLSALDQQQRAELIKDKKLGDYVLKQIQFNDGSDQVKIQISRCSGTEQKQALGRINS